MSSNLRPSVPVFSRPLTYGLLAVAGTVLAVMAMPGSRLPPARPTSHEAPTVEVATPRPAASAPVRRVREQGTGVPDAAAVFRGREIPPEDPVPTF
jgi:hypothetical protein